MGTPKDLDQQNNLSEVNLCAFALTDCTVHIESQAAKYLRAVHRTALELAVPNLFGAEIGGFWLKADQINQLRTLPDCYPATEIEFVRRAIDAYIEAQIKDLHRSTKILSSVEILCRDKPLAIDQPGKLQSGRIG